MNLPSTSIVLASASPRRSELLSRLGVPFLVRPADVDETPAGSFDHPPASQALRIAERKALAVIAQDDEIVLAADTIVAAPGGMLLGKPVDAADARRILGLLSGSVHDVVTGVYLRRESDGLVLAGAEITRVTMRDLSRDEIDAYVATGESFGKAGAYAIQEHGDQFVTSIEGSWSNVVGLPLGLTQGLLELAGVAVGAVAG